jgi:cysteine desulfurase/selenocysteine lyase
VRVEPPHAPSIEIEYAANHIAMLQQSARVGFQIIVVPSNEFGCLDVGALDAIITENHPRVKLVCVTHIPRWVANLSFFFILFFLFFFFNSFFLFGSNGGVVNDARAIGDICRKHDVLFLLDACQSIGQMSLNVQKMNCSFMSCTGRKYLRAPRGTGFLYVSTDVLNTPELVGEPITLDLHSAYSTSVDTYEVCRSAKRYEQFEVRAYSISSTNLRLKLFFLKIQFVGLCE